MIAPSIIKLNTDHFICGYTYRCVWALREYPTSTNEQAILRGFSYHTLEEYMIRAKFFMLYTNRSLEELTEQDIRAYLLYLLDVKKLSSASVNGYNSALRFLYAHSNPSGKR